MQFQLAATLIMGPRNKIFRPKTYRVSRYLSIQKTLIVIKIIINLPEAKNRLLLDIIENINIPTGGYKTCRVQRVIL